MDELHHFAATSAADRTPAIRSPVSLPVVTRECGECQACCEFLTIVEDEITKPAFEKCQHQCAAGCAIHNHPGQPKLCREFRCAWKKGELPEDMRPDKCGVIVSNNSINGPGYKLQAVAYRPDALTERVRYQINRLAKKRKGLVRYITPTSADAFLNLYNSLHYKLYGTGVVRISTEFYSIIPAYDVSAAGITDEDVARAVAIGLAAGELSVIQREDGFAAGPIVDRNGTTFATLVPKGKEELFPNGYRINAPELA